MIRGTSGGSIGCLPERQKNIGSTDMLPLTQRPLEEYLLPPGRVEVSVCISVD